MSSIEVNFDGLVGPTHSYAGLSYGNLAAMQSRSQASSPKAAALEGLAKMKFLMDLGVRQAILPPHQRPHLPTLCKLGFTGTDAEILEKAHKQDPTLLASVCSASSMWAANAATVSPSPDTSDGRVHFTPANLISNRHRAIEASTTTRIIRSIFADQSHFVVHEPLPPDLPDEGAANHMRLCHRYGEHGLEIFVYGRSSTNSLPGPTKFPARQSYETSAAIARNHLLDPKRVLFVQQNPAAIDAGAFHNDVVAVANERVMLYQKDAFADTEVWNKIIQACPHEDGLYLTAEKVSLSDAVASYLFNSQLVTLPDESMSLIAPAECKSFPSVMSFTDAITDGNPIKSAHFVTVRQSMRNGGGPACLRLRVVLNDQEISAVKGRVFLDALLHDELKAWIEKHYRDELRPDDLRDPKLLHESLAALDELTRILQLGPVFEFQQH